MGKISSSVWGMAHSRCLLDILMELSGRQVEIQIKETGLDESWNHQPRDGTAIHRTGEITVECA